MRILCMALAASLAGCAVGPDYQRPSLPDGVSAPAFKEAGAWKTAHPGTVDAALPWWTGFGDARLDALIAQADLANQNLKLAEAQYREAQALVQNAQSAWSPTLGLGASGQRARSLNAGEPVQGDTHAWSLQAGSPTSGAGCGGRSKAPPTARRPARPTWPRPGWRCRPRWPTTISSCA